MSSGVTTISMNYPYFIVRPNPCDSKANMLFCKIGNDTYYSPIGSEYNQEDINTLTGGVHYDNISDVFIVYINEYKKQYGLHRVFDRNLSIPEKPMAEMFRHFTLEIKSIDDTRICIITDIYGNIYSAKTEGMGTNNSMKLLNNALIKSVSFEDDTYVVDFSYEKVGKVKFTRGMIKITRPDKPKIDFSDNTFIIKHNERKYESNTLSEDVILCIRCIKNFEIIQDTEYKIKVTFYIENTLWKEIEVYNILEPVEVKKGVYKKYKIIDNKITINGTTYSYNEKDGQYITQFSASSDRGSPYRYSMEEGEHYVYIYN